MNKITIIADSCCNLFEKDLKGDKINFHVVPLTLVLGSEEFLDDEKLDTQKFVDKMNNSKACPHSACPNPDAFYEIMKKNDNIIVVTLSSKLSATHASAIQAVEMLKQSYPDKKVHVLDTLSAAAGLDYICFKIRDLVKEGKSYDEIIGQLDEIRKNTRVRFLLQNLDNLIKNGRLNKVVGKILTTAKIKLICGDDGEGEIKKFGMAMGVKKGLEKLGELPTSDGVTSDMPILITHVHNKSDADFLHDLFKSKGFTNIDVRLMRGISSLYAADKGIVIAY